jgi:hypothetical protein
VENFEVELLICKEVESWRYQKVDVTLNQFTLQSLGIGNHETKHDTRMAPGEPVDYAGDEAPGAGGNGSNPNFPGRRVGEKLDILHTLT